MFQLSEMSLYKGRVKGEASSVVLKGLRRGFARKQNHAFLLDSDFDMCIIVRRSK